MSNHIQQILEQWQPIRDTARWVLGTVSHTEGSVYRKTGALMLISDRGDKLGMLSGGCLEGDLALQAQRALTTNRAHHVTYDANDEGGLAWKLGIGCGGLAEITLLPCGPDNHYLLLPELADQLEQGRAARYTLLYGDQDTAPSAALAETGKSFGRRVPGEPVAGGLQIGINPLPRLLILGAGADMQPVSKLAASLGWRVTLADPRPANARERYFPEARVHCADVEALADELGCTDAVIIANHSMNLDAKAVQAVQQCAAKYVALLGPARRKQEVLELAGLKESELRQPIAGPMGLALGGDLPESVALSVLSECHAVLHESSALPMSADYWLDQQTRSRAG